MKNIFLFIAVSASLALSSCKGDPGPKGDSGVEYSQVFEATVRNFQFDSARNQLFSDFYSFPFTVYESDVVLAYRYEGQEDLGNGEKADIWTMLPSTFFFSDGTGDMFQYNFNHTFIDIQFTVEGNFPLNNIGSNYSSNQIFRIAVVPAAFAQRNPTMNEVMEVMKNEGGKITQLERLD